MGASAAVVLLVPVLLSVRGAEAQVAHASRGQQPWWTLYAQWLFSPATVLILTSSAVSLICHELVAAGVSRANAILHGAQATAPVGPPSMEETAWQAAVNRTWSEVDAVWTDAEQALTQALFGWLRDTAVTTHDVLHGALDLAIGTVNDTLGSTPLHDPVAQFVQCVLGNKVHSVDTALQWAQAHAFVHIHLPARPALPPMPLTAWTQHARTVLADALAAWDARAAQRLALARAQAACALVGIPGVLLLLAVGVTCAS